MLADLRAAEPGIQVEVLTSNTIANLLRREANIAVRMVRPAQGSLIARKQGGVAICAAAHERYLSRAGTPRQPEDLLQHSFIGFDRDEAILRGLAGFGLPLTRENFAVRTVDQMIYGRLVAEGAGIGFEAAYNQAQFPGLHRVLPMLKIPPPPCWLAVRREIRANPVVRRVYDFLAQALPPASQWMAAEPGKTAQVLARPRPRNGWNMGRLWFADDASHKLRFAHGRAKRSCCKQTACPWAGTVMFGTRFAR